MLHTNQECKDECYNNTSKINSCCVNANRIKHHSHLLPQAKKEGCAVKRSTGLVLMTLGNFNELQLMVTWSKRKIMETVKGKVLDVIV